MALLLATLGWGFRRTDLWCGLFSLTTFFHLFALVHVGVQHLTFAKTHAHDQLAVLDGPIASPAHAGS